MSKIPLCTISLEGMSQQEKEQLISALKSSQLEVQLETERFFVIDDVVELIALIGGTITLLEKGTEYAQAIIEWRKKRKAQGKKTQGKLKQPNSKPLDLNTATDEEISKWIEERVRWLSRKK